MNLRSMTRFRLTTLIFSLFFLGSDFQNAEAEPLPINAFVLIDGIAGISNHPAPEKLSRELADAMQTYIEDALFEHWHFTSGTANIQVTLSIAQQRARSRLQFTLSFEGDVRRRVPFRGIQPETVPGDAYFNSDVLDAVQEMLVEKGNEILRASHEVHLASDDALKTVLRIDRPLQAENRLRYREDKLDVKWDRHAHFQTYENRGTGFFEFPILLAPGDTRKGVLRPKIYQTWINMGELPSAEICLRRTLPDPVDETQPELDVRCPLNGKCILRGALPAGWATDQCSPATEDGTYVIPLYFGAARAATRDPEQWVVPSLDMLFDRVEDEPDQFVGFTEFVIRSREISGIDADTYTAEIFANGVPVLLNGQPPQELLRRFDPKRGFVFRFGLENLQFAGRGNGCERIEVQFNFLNDDRGAAEKIHLTREYAALRHAPSKVLETDWGTFSWTGEYIAPTERSEHGLFLTSLQFDPTDPDGTRRVVRKMNELRERIEAFNWSIPARDLGLGVGLESVFDPSVRLNVVGQLRPPRTVGEDGLAAYGLLLGVQQPNGQLQFTFDLEQATTLRNYVWTRRLRSPAEREVVPNELYVYTYDETRRIAPDWVCGD